VNQSAARHSLLPLVLEGIVVEAFGRRLLDEVDLTLDAGPLTVLLGPNGAGKSLLLRICHGLLAPHRGRVLWAGVTTDVDAHRPHISLVAQRPVLLRRSARANIEYALAVRGVDRRSRRERARAALVTAGLRDLARSPARVLSLGEQQRLTLARARATEPAVLFLDEPTANLDPASTRAVERAILEAHQGGTKIVWVTHDLQQAERLADEVVFLHRGRLLERAPALDFFGGPTSAEARAFLDGTLER